MSPAKGNFCDYFWDIGNVLDGLNYLDLLSRGVALDD